MKELSSIPQTMTVIVAREPGPPHVLRPEKRALPSPAPGEVLIKVAAAGVNGADLTQRRGKYAVPKGAPDILGLEVAGEIVAVGQGVGEWRVSEQVCALTIGGGYSEFCSVPAAQCLPVPHGLSTIEAAALPEVAMTVWLNVFELADLRPGETLLIHGGASGIGTMAIQLAHSLGAKAIVTAGSAEKCTRCEQIGASKAINYNKEDFVQAALAQTGGVGVDVVLDMVGGDYLQRDLQALAPGGRLIMLAFKKPATVELDCGLIQNKGLWITGSRLRPRPIAEKGRIAAAVRRAVWPLIEEGRVRVLIDSKFPLVDAWRAHEYMEAGRHIGKILLIP